MKPNFLLFLSKQCPDDITSLDSPKLTGTPTLDRLASQGTSFRNAWCPSPLSASSQASLASGKYYDRCRVWTQKDQYPPHQATFYQSLRDDAGYHVAGCGKLDLFDPESIQGDAVHQLLAELGFSGGIGIEDALTGDNHLAGQNAKILLNAIPPGLPWFMQINFTAPMVCETIDGTCADIIDLIATRGELSHTLIVFASSHGQTNQNEDAYYQPSLGIPLIVSGPGIRKNCITSAPVSLHDLAATFLDYAGCASLPMMDAMSLRPALEGDAALARDHAYAGLDNWRALFDGRFKYVWRKNAEASLFDLDNDPDENMNAIAWYPDQADHFSHLMEKYYREIPVKR